MRSIRRSSTECYIIEIDSHREGEKRDKKGEIGTEKNTGRGIKREWRQTDRRSGR